MHVPSQQRDRVVDRRLRDLETIQPPHKLCWPVDVVPGGADDDDSFGFDTLLRTNMYLLDWDDWEAFNEIYEARIGLSYVAPPRTTVDVDHLGLDYRIEIEVVAHVRQR